MFNKRNTGYSVIQWTLTLGLMVAVFAFFSSPFKRVLYDRSYALTDYLFWGPGNTMQDPKKDASSFTRSTSGQAQNSSSAYAEGIVNMTLNSSGTTDTFSLSTGEGSESLFKDW